LQYYTGEEKMDAWLEDWVEELMKNWKDEVVV
jgi:hypothetical protein